MVTAVQETTQAPTLSVVCDARVLHSALGRIYKLANGGNKYASLPILDCVLIVAEQEGEISLTCTDLTSIATVVVPHQTTWPAHGRLCVNAKALYTALSGVRGPVTLERGERGCALRTGSSAFILPSFDADEYPVVPEADTPVVAVATADLVTAFKQVEHAASRDTTRGVLRCVYGEVAGDVLTFTASDAYRLASAQVAGIPMRSDGARTALLLPVSSVEAAIALFGAKGVDQTLCLSCAERVVALYTPDGSSLVVRPEQDRFVNYRQCFPKEAIPAFTVAQEHLLAALKQVAGVLGKGDPRAVSVTARDDILTLEDRLGAAEPARARVAVPVVMGAGAGAHTVAVNIDYLLDVVRLAGKGATITLELDQHGQRPDRSATTWRVNGAAYPVYLIMPLTQPR